MRGARRGQTEGLLTGFAKDVDRAGVALSGPALHMVGTCGSGGAASCERRGAALVGAQPPAGRRGVVDRAANERMPETEAPGRVGRAQEIEPQQLVDRLHNVRLGNSGRGRGQLGLEGVAGHSRSFQHETFRTGQQRELLCQRRGDDRRHADRRERTLVVHRRAPRLAVGRPRELLEVEGIAATLQVKRVRVGRGDRIAQELTRLLRAERAQLDPSQQVGAPGPLESTRQALGHVTRAHC